MPEPQLIADEHIPKTVVKRLNSFGIDAVHVDGGDLKGTSDEDLYELAASEGRAILTMDSDFRELVEEKSGPSVLYFTKRVSNRKMASEVVRVFNSTTIQDLKSETIYLPWE